MQVMRPRIFRTCLRQTTRSVVEDVMMEEVGVDFEEDILLAVAVEMLLAGVFILGYAARRLHIHSMRLFFL